MSKEITKEEFQEMPVEKLIYLPSFSHLIVMSAIECEYFELMFKARIQNNKYVTDYGQEINTQYYKAYRKRVVKK